MKKFPIPLILLLLLLFFPTSGWAVESDTYCLNTGTVPPAFVPCSSGNPLAVTGSFTPAGTQNTNWIQTLGSAVTVGTGASTANTPRVTTSSDSTIGLVAGSAIIGNVRIDQTTPGTTNGVQVNAALPAGENHIGAVGGAEFHVPTTPTVTNASYVAGKCMGGLQTVSVARSSGVGGILNKIVYTSKAGSTSAITFYVFKSSPTTSCADTATMTLSSSDLPLLVGVWSISPAVIANQTQSYAEIANLGASFVPSGNTNVYVYIVAAATQTPGSTSDIIFNLIGLQD